MAEITTVSDLDRMRCPECGHTGVFHLDADAMALGVWAEVRKGKLVLTPIQNAINEREAAMCTGCTFEGAIWEFNEEIQPHQPPLRNMGGGRWSARE